MRQASTLRFRKFHFEAGRNISLNPPEWLIIKPASGTVEVLAPGMASVVLDNDQAFVVPSMSSLTLSIVQHADLLIIFWLPELLGGVFTLPELNAIERRFAEKAPDLVRCDKTLSFDILELEKANNERSQLIRNVKLLDIITRMLASHLENALGREQNYVGARFRLMETLGTTVAEQIISLGPSDLASKCRCHTRQFSRLFKECFAMSFSDLKVRWRVKRASLSLLEGDRRPHDVALAAEFFSAQLFERAFLKYMNASPSEWQTLHRDWKQFSDL